MLISTGIFLYHVNRIFRLLYPDKAPDTPVFDKFLDDSSGGDEEVKHLILTFLGYMISPGSGKHLILMGPASDSGKSVLVNWCRRLLGKGNTCAISIHNFTRSFEVAQLLGKSANFCADISGAILNEATVATLKRLTGHDLETLNGKYRDPFPYENFAKMVFCCNMASIRQRGENSYHITVSAGRDYTGKKIIHTTTYKPDPALSLKKRQKAVEAFALEFEKKILNREAVDGMKVSLAEFSERWMEQYAVLNLQPGTIQHYKSELRLHPIIRFRISLIGIMRGVRKKGGCRRSPSMACAIPTPH